MNTHRPSLLPLLPALAALALTAVACDGAEPIDSTSTTTASLAAEQCAGECPIGEWIRTERYAEAREVLQAKLEVKPRDLKSILLLATVELLDEEYEEAQVVLEAELDQGNQDVRLLEKRALASFLSEDLEAALEGFMDVLEQLADPEQARQPHREARAWTGLATVQYNRGELDEAEEIARDVLEMADAEPHVDPAYGQFVLGLTSAKRGDDDAAFTYYSAILDRYPGHSPALNNLGGVYYRKGDLKTARTYLLAAFENAGASRETAAIAWSNVGELDLLEGAYEAAEDKLLEASTISKRTAAPFFNLAVLYDLLDRGKDSRAHLAVALALDARGISRWNSTWFHDDWKLQFDALVLEQEGDLDAARPLWTALLESETPILVETARRHLGLDELAVVDE